MCMECAPVLLTAVCRDNPICDLTLRQRGIDAADGYRGAATRFGTMMIGHGAVRDPTVITLHSDKGLIQIDSWADITSRPGFAANLNPKEHTLKAIIGRYVFKEKIGCGLSDCHSPHNKGYIVVTAGGAETNIGKDCGKKYFGVEFETLSRQLERDLEAFENRETLSRFSFQLDEYEARIQSLRHQERGAAWVYRNITQLTAPGKACPDAIVRRVSEMIRARQNQVTIERRATDSEIDAIEAAQNRSLQRPHYIPEVIAEIEGFASHGKPVAFYSEKHTVFTSTKRPVLVATA